MTKAEVKDRLEHYRIPDDQPIVAQISRFDRWKDPEGVVEAFRIARKKVDATWSYSGTSQPTIPKAKRCSNRCSNIKAIASIFLP